MLRIGVLNAWIIDPQMDNLHILEAWPRESSNYSNYIDDPQSFFGVVIDIIGDDKSIAKTYLNH